MKFYISTTGIKRVTISSSGAAGKASQPTATTNRRISSRTLLPVALVLGIALPFLFVRIAFLVLESATACSSPLDCIGWRFFSGDDASLKLREELSRALVEAKEGDINEEGIESFNELVKDMTSKREDIKAFAFKTKAMLLRMERKVQSARQRESIYWHLASHGVPKSLHCLCLKLAEEYAVNAMARSRLPPPEYVSRLVDPSFHHLVLLTDNVLAASTVVSSTIQNSANPGKLVFHIVTDKKTYTPMHAWFAINSIKSAVVEVKGLHQFDWSQEVNVGVKEMLEIHRLIWRQYYNNLKEEDFEYIGEHKRYLEALSPSSLSLLNHLRIYIPELFPDLNKIVFLDDDIVVQHDISPLWELDLNGKVVGAVVNSWCGDDCCPGRKYRDYLNFSHPIISSNFDGDHCAWLYGMNIFDIEAWRRTNITATYHQWLKLSLKSGLALWHPGVLPPSLIAFEGHVHPIDPSWHVAGLGYQSAEVHPEILEAAAVIHFSGPAKPWLEIGFPEVRSLWNKYKKPETQYGGPERRRFCLQSLLTLSRAQSDIGYIMSIIENSRRFHAIHHMVGIFKLLQDYDSGEYTRTFLRSFVRFSSRAFSPSFSFRFRVFSRPPPPRDDAAVCDDPRNEQTGAMSDGEGSTQSATAAVETGGGGQPDNVSTTAMAADEQQQQQQQNVATTKDDGEPNPKKAKLSVGDVFGRGGGGGGAAGKQQSASEKLEHRLGGILCCAVCLDLPRSAIYQCTNGHLMCAGCFAHLLADARLRDEMATCPNCRVDIAKNTATRNLAVEKAVSELPSECQFCAKEFPRNTLHHHEQQLCAERPVKCGYSKIGCPWRGPSHEASEHEKVCPHPSASGKDVMSALDAMDQKFQEEKLLYDTIFDLMSFEKITFNDLQLKPYRTEEFVHKLYYETARFSAFNFQWVVKTRINNMQRDPALSVDRHMSYQLILKTKIATPMSVHYLVVKGPFGDMKVNPKIFKFEFNENETETQFVTLPLPDSAECNRLLAAKTINIRLIMFLVSK